VIVVVVEHPLKFKPKILTNATSGCGLQDITLSNFYVVQLLRDTFLSRFRSYIHAVNLVNSGRAA
jgi:hypothetical protein